MGKTRPAWLSDETWGQRAEEVLSLLPEHHRPWVAGLLSLQVGRGGDLWVSEIVGMLSRIRGSVTKTGLRVRALLSRKLYPKGVKVSDAELAELELERGEVCPGWNYTISPRLA